MLNLCFVLSFLFFQTKSGDFYEPKIDMGVAANVVSNVEMVKKFYCLIFFFFL